MTKYQVLKTLRSNEDAAVYLWRGETYLDDGESARMISPSIFCKLFRDGRGEIVATETPGVFVLR
jgi:hypothetical protein